MSEERAGDVPGAGVVPDAGIVPDAEAVARTETVARAGEVPGAEVVPDTEAVGASPARISRALLDEMIGWARRGYPNEACGIVAGDTYHGDGGVAVAFHGLRNEAASPLRYRIDAAEQLRTQIALDDADRVTWAVFHSHVRSPAVPSPTDIRNALLPDGAPWFPGSLYLICTLADEPPAIRAWRIEGEGDAVEVALEAEE